MDICELNSEKVKLFLKYCFTIDALKHLYNHSNQLKKYLRGFRVETIPEDYIINVTCNLIEKRKDLKLIDLFNKFYDESFKDNLYKEKEKLIKDDFDDEVAYGIVIKKYVNKEFLNTFYEIENISEEKQRKFDEYSKMYSSAEKAVKRECKIEFESFRNEINKALGEIKENYRLCELKNESNFDLGCKLEDLDNDIKKKLDDLEIFKCQFLKNEKEEIQSSIDLKTEKIEKNVFDKLNKLNSKNEEILLKKIMEEVKKSLDENNALLESKFSTMKISNANIEDEKILVNYFKNESYDKMDDYLEINIGDVIDKCVSGNTFDALKQYLIEIIYSNKPIICTKENSLFLVNVLSSIITGNNYYEIVLDENTTDKKLIEEIEKLQTFEGNKVILIKNKIGVSDYQYLLDYIKNQPFNYKFIFEILYEKEIKLMPIEIINDFYFYLGNIDYKKAEYTYSFDFTNSNRNTIKCGAFDDDLNNFGIHNNENLLMNVKYYGLLSFSIIPFLKIHEGIEYDELLSKISNEKYKLFCRDVINGITNI